MKKALFTLASVLFCTITFAQTVPPVIGDFHDGGIVFFIDTQNGGGLVCDINDLPNSEGLLWNNYKRC